MLYNLELQVFPDHFSCVVFPRNYRLSKIHFRVFALVKALKFNLSSMISRNSAFSNSIISTHKDLREILPHRKHRVTSQLSLASSSLVTYPLLTLSKPTIKRVLRAKALRIKVCVRRPAVGRKVRIPAERTLENEMVISRKVGIF